MVIFLLALVVGAVMGVIVPWWAAGQDRRILNGLVDGRTIDFTIGGYHTLHWSWTAFGVTTVVAWILLSKAEQRY
jgi:hypothetical protein